MHEKWNHVCWSGEASKTGRIWLSTNLSSLPLISWIPYPVEHCRVIFSPHQVAQWLPIEMGKNKWVLVINSWTTNLIFIRMLCFDSWECIAHIIVKTICVLTSILRTNMFKSRFMITICLFWQKWLAANSTLFIEHFIWGNIRLQGPQKGHIKSGFVLCIKTIVKTLKLEKKLSFLFCLTNLSKFPLCVISKIQWAFWTRKFAQVQQQTETGE